MRRIAVGVVGLLAVVGMVTTTAGASVAPSARVSPHVGLSDGSAVTVRWSGMTSPFIGRRAQFLEVAECNRAFTAENATNENYNDDCNDEVDQLSTHRGSWAGEVHEGTVGLDTLPCNAITCEFVVVDIEVKHEHMTVDRLAIAPISFRS